MDRFTSFLRKKRVVSVKPSRRILLYGNSVILGAIGASLRCLSQFEVIALVKPLQEMQKLDAVNPDILLFDLETTNTEAVFSMLETNPNLLLIGISPDTNLVKIWSGRQVRELSTQDLLELIKREANHLSVESDTDEDHPF
jgi:hypothetical protein